MSIITEIKSSYKYGGNLTRLTYINLLVFLLYGLIRAITFISGIPIGNEYAYLLAVPADLSALAQQPWTIVTYMFFHEEFLHILFNMLWLYWFGKLFLQFLSQTQLLWVYLLGGISGAALYIAAYNLLPVFSAQGSFALGASASVMAIVFAVSALRPNYTIYLLFIGQIRLKYLALATLLLDIVSIPFSNAGGHIAHIGGAIFGLIFARKMLKNVDITRPFSNIRSINLKRGKKSKMKVNYRNPETDWEYNSRKNVEQKKIDEILDKISRSGYNSLTTEEKNTLFKMKNNSN